MKRPFAVIGFTVFLTIAFLFDKETGVTAAVFAGFAVALVVALLSKKFRKAKTVPVCMGWPSFRNQSKQESRRQPAAA